MAETLIDRLRNFEDGFIERKTEGAAGRAELRKTLVAFANSVPEDRTAVLLIGVGDKGQFDGVTNPDQLQKTLRQVCERDCYPPIVPQIEVITQDGKPILAIVIGQDPPKHGPGGY